MTKPIEFIQGLEGIIGHYDAVLLDIWGTLHNGEQLFPTVLDALRELKNAGVQVGLLSNSPSRVKSVTDRLASSYGITPDLYRAAHNSGENSYLALQDRSDDWHRNLGQRYYFIHAAIHAQNYHDLPYESVPFDDAQFIIITKTLDYNESVQDYDVLLSEAANRGLPMLCANPDRVVGIGDTLFVCPGTVAAYYETMGGNVYYHGKPHSAVYHHMAKLLGDPDRRRVLAIGDAFETDIRGGNQWGCDTLLLTSGIHAAEINMYQPTEDLERLVAQYDARPTYVMDQLRW